MDRQPPTPLIQKIQSLSFPIFVKRELTCAPSFLLLLLLLSFLLLFNLIHPFQSDSLLRIGFLNKTLPSNRNSVSSEVCDYSYGRWVRDENYQFQSYSEVCPFLDPGFRCHRNGRKDEDYQKWRWQPEGCDLPRFNASDLLKRLRNGRIVFAGDSIGRNQWESLVCMLAQAVNHSRIYEENGKPITKHKGYLSIRFHDYNLTVEYYRVPFLVIVDSPQQNSSDHIRRTIRIDQLHWYSKQWVGADVLVFNAGHWWNQDKTIKMGCYFQEGGIVNVTMNVMEAFRKSLQTWKSWAVQNLDPVKSHIFFRSYSPVHFREGTWSKGGRCDSITEPEADHTKLETEPWNNVLIYETIEQMKGVYKNVEFLNITYLTGFRIDGHPSIHREPGTPVPFPQDCSHWCLPGVPDAWNELIYANMLSKGYTRKTQGGKMI